MEPSDLVTRKTLMRIWVLGQEGKNWLKCRDKKMETLGSMTKIILLKTRVEGKGKNALKPKERRQADYNRRRRKISQKTKVERRNNNVLRLRKRRQAGYSKAEVMT